MLGARFSAYWWQRTGAFLLRLLHGILGLHPHRAWLFVDDLLAALHRKDADSQLALMVMFFAAISAPISWKKVQFQDNLTWCGWRINFLHETIELTPEKNYQIERTVARAAQSRKGQAQTPRAGSRTSHLGYQSEPRTQILASAIVHRPALAAGLHDLCPCAFMAIFPFSVRRQSPDLPRVAPSHKSAWVRIADASAEHTRLSKLSKHSVEWLLQCFHLDLACPLRSKPMLACKAAADACAEGSIVGIGGWFISRNSVAWFAETWQFQEVQEQWPCLTKEAQRYIACFETLAQLALMRIAWSCEGQGAHGICMPTGTDNTASKAGVNKLFTTSWPLQVFVQLVAAWAHKHKWSVIASHIPGEHNIWADQLSRGNTSAFQNRPEGRVRFRPHDFRPHASALTLHPADAPWRPEHVAAAQTH